MLLSEYIEYLQNELNNHGDADAYGLSEFGENEYPCRLTPHYETVKKGYYDTDKEEWVDDVEEVSYYYLY